MSPRSQRIQKRVLQLMLLISMILIIWGETRIITEGYSHIDTMEGLRQVMSGGGLVAAALRAEPAALIAVGIAALIVTPFLRLFLLLVDFLIQRDWIYTALSVVIGIVIATSFLLRIHH